MADELLKKMGFKGIYRDNGVLIFLDRRKRKRIAIWLHRFQKKVNEIVRGEFSKSPWSCDNQNVRR
eukprot:14993377-Ditylum_brightwellii.AAC.1